MRFGVLQFFSWPRRSVPLPEIYERAIERVDIMDKNGFDAVWLAEHHFSTYSVCPSVLMMGTHLAARTHNLRIGTAVTLAAFYHPLRLAEELALLDVLSDGRVNWGAGRGFDKKEFEVFDVAREDSYPRFRETVQVVIEAWRQERMSFSGKYCNYEDVEVLPKPLQQPYPPVWMASSSPEAIGWAAQEGFDILMDPHSSNLEIERKKRFYHEQLEEHGHESQGRTTPIARLLAIEPTEDEAEKTARRGASWIFHSYINASGVTDALLSHEGRAEQAQRKSEPPDPVARYLDDTVIWGTPARVADELQRLSTEGPLDYLLCAPLSHRTFMLLVEEVMPRLT